LNRVAVKFSFYYPRLLVVYLIAAKDSKRQLDFSEWAVAIIRHSNLRYFFSTKTKQLVWSWIVWYCPECWWYFARCPKLV